MFYSQEYDRDMLRGWKFIRFEDKRTRDEYVRRMNGKKQCCAIRRRPNGKLYGLHQRFEFSPDMMPPSDQNEIVVEMPVIDQVLKEMVTNWPCDVILTSVLGAIVTGKSDGEITRTHCSVLDRAGIRKMNRSIRFNGKVVRISILRNADKWLNVKAINSIRAELYRVPLLQTDHITRSMRADAIKYG